MVFVKKNTLLLIHIALAFLIISCSKEAKVKDLQFDIGDSVDETLRPHGVPYRGQNTDGYIDYGYIGFPDGVVTAVFKRQGMDIHIDPIYAIRFYSDDRLSPSNSIATAEMSLSPNLLRSNEKAYAATTNLIDQFQRGKWKRFIPKDSVGVTGRSSILGLSETMDDRDSTNPIDPALTLNLDEFTLLSKQGAKWIWIADDRIAQLTVKNSSYGTTESPSYSIDVSFELKDAYDFYEKMHQEEWIKDRGEAGAKEAAIIFGAEKKQLEEAAIKRGDSVFSN